MPAYSIRTLLRRLEIKNSVFAASDLFLDCCRGRSFAIYLAYSQGFSYSIRLKVPLGGWSVVVDVFNDNDRDLINR